MKEDALVQLVSSGIIGGLIVLLFIFLKKFGSWTGPKIVIGKKFGLILVGVLLGLSILLLSL